MLSKTIVCYFHRFLKQIIIAKICFWRLIDISLSRIFDMYPQIKFYAFWDDSLIEQKLSLCLFFYYGTYGHKCLHDQFMEILINNFMTY